MFVQIVKFKLKTDVSRESFLDLTAQTVSWLKNRTGFIAYELYEGAEFWSDRLVWTNQEAAQNGRNDFLTTDIAKKMLHFVEDGYSSFFGQVVVSA